MRPYRAATVSPIERLFPLHVAQAHSALAAASPADLALYDDGGLSLCPPSKRWAKKNLVYYHGLLWNPGSWLGNEEVDLHCVNSPYLQRVLGSMLCYPDWRRRRCLDPRGHRPIATLTLPVPCVEEPDGSPWLEGGEVPADLQARIERGELLGHALQLGKVDWVASLSILFALNELAKANDTPPVRLLVCEQDLTAERRATLDKLLEPYECRTEDLYLPVAFPLSQRALFKVMRACAFGLAYNVVPESLGFYVLESVHNLCPVYTNGIGNNRYSLPPEHGLTVRETPAMALGDTEAYGPVAEEIYADFGQRPAVVARCRRGQAYIRATYSQAALERDLGAALERLERRSEGPVEFESLQVAASSLVRSYDAPSRTVVSDYRVLTLTQAQAELFAELVGRRCAEVRPRDAEQLAEIDWLFANGVLGLVPAT